MKLKQLFTDDSAVSPVIGVILMVAITVILAAVIGTFVLNLGGSVSQTTPQASFGFDYNDRGDEGWDDADEISITHESGTSIDADRLSVIVGGSATDDIDGWPGTVSAGSTATVTYTDNTTWENGDSVRVTWSSENNENSATLSESTVPEA